MKIEQCQWGFAGYAPDGAAPNLGVTDFRGGVFRINAVDFEHYGYDGDPERAWRYTPGGYADILDRDNNFTGTIAAVYVINSEQPPTGTTDNATIIVRGASGTNSPIAAYRLHDHTAAATRVPGGVPANPAAAPPGVPTIGAATAGVESVQAAFTPAASGEPATGFTATAYNGSAVAVGSASGASSPITVSGLTAGVQVTVKVRATNSAGSSAESAASNAVTPLPAGGLPSDDFERDNAASLGTSTSGHTWLGDPQDTWAIAAGRAEANTTGTAFNPVWVECGDTQQRVEAVIAHRDGERGLLGRVADAANCVMFDYERAGNSANLAVYERVDNALTSRGTAVLSNVPDDTDVHLVLELDGTAVRAYAHRVIDPQGTPKIEATLGGSAPNGTKAGFYSLVNTVTHTVFDDFAVTEVTP